jgi:hypothetical protein
MFQFQVTKAEDERYYLSSGLDMTEYRSRKDLIMGIREFLELPHQGRPKGSKNKPKQGVDKAPE